MYKAVSHRFCKGVGAHVVWLAFGIILLVLTAALLYVIFPRSDCDRMAEVSAQEIKNAIECAAKYDDGIDPVTGKPCNTATVRLCQEDKFSIFGVGYIQAYLGLMVPEYMIYYQKFPTQRYKTLFEGPVIGFTESYPFERAYVGQRFYDIRPTLTQFKQFFKTKYLEKGCTSEQGLCLNIRGREEVIRVDGVIPDVRLQRNGMLFAETNPKFYLVAPCYAKVTFWRGSDEKIYGRPIKYATPGASNYCFMDEVKLQGLMATYAAEAQCEIGMIALDFISLGSKKAVEESAKIGAKVAVKAASRRLTRELIKESVKSILKKYGKKLGKEAQKEAVEAVIRKMIKKDSKLVLKNFEEEFAEGLIKTSVRKSIKGVEGLSGKEIAPEVQEEIVESVTKEIMEESAEESVETAMEKAANRGINRAGREIAYEIPEEEAEKLASKATQAAIEAGIESHTDEIVARGLTSGARAKIAGKILLQRYATMEGLPLARTKPEKLLWMFGAVPCVDVDICRAGSACSEATMWPGGWFGQVAELTDKKMKGAKISETVSDIFFECCGQLNYGAETDPEKIICTEPAHLVELVKPDLGLNASSNLTLAKVADYLELPREEIPASCELAIGDNSKDCRDAMEIRKLKLTDTCSAEVSEHTYDFGQQKSAGQITVMARLFQSREEGCPAETNIIIELSNDTKTWVEANRTTAAPYPEDNFIYVFGQNNFRYLRVREDGACFFDTSFVVLDPRAGKFIEAEPNAKYDLTPGFYNYFIAPEGFTSKASNLCKSIDHCITVAKWLEEEGGWIKWADEGAGPVGEDFNIIEGDKIGIYTTEVSEVVFVVG